MHSLKTLLTLVLLAQNANGVAAGAPAQGPQAAEQGPSPVPPPQGGRDFDQPPPGTRADQALWKSAIDVSNDILLQRNRAMGLQRRIGMMRYDERLAVLRKGSTETARAAGQLEDRLVAEWHRNYEILARQWPVDPTRGCRYPAMLLEGSMFAADSAAKERQMTSAREDVRDCVDRAQLVLGPLSRSNQDLEAMVAEAEKVLGDPVSGAVPAPPAAPRTGDSR